MIKRQYRFRGHRALGRVYKNGVSARTQPILIKYLPNNRDYSRFAVVVSKKVSKSAPKRNRIRRRIYELVRLEYDNLKPGYDIVIVVFDASLAEISGSELSDLFQKLISRTELSA